MEQDRLTESCRTVNLLQNSNIEKDDQIAKVICTVII